MLWINLPVFAESGRPETSETAKHCHQLQISCPLVIIRIMMMRIAMVWVMNMIFEGGKFHNDDEDR